MDFNEHLADMAADGHDLDEPIPRRRKPTPIDDFYYPDEEDEPVRDNTDDTATN